MLTQEELDDLRSIINVQHDLVSKITQKVENIENLFSTNEKTTQEILSTQKMLDDLLQDIELLSEDEIQNAIQESEDIETIYRNKMTQTHLEIQKINFTTWDKYVADCYKYCLINELDPFAPYELLLSDDDLKTINSEKYSKQYKWDKWDYLFVGLAGIIAALTDIFIVAIPKDMTSGVYEGQKGSDLTKWLQSLRLPEGLQKWLESVAKVPYDKTGGADHRFDTFGHDPVLGMIFGLIDIMRGTSTSIKNGHIIIEKVGAGVNPLEALIKQFLHLCSDVFTPKGLPVPFASIFKLLDVGEFKRPNGKTATTSQLAKWMYANGYDLRHFITMSITPASIEIILRLYIMIRHYAEHDELTFKVGGNPKYRMMLLSSHTIACAANIGKVYLRQGNPLAINYAEWLALIRYLVPSIKYWIFDKGNLELTHLQRINDNVWSELLENSDKILIKSKLENVEPIILG